MYIRRINFGHIIGATIALTTSYQMWGGKGFWFTFGLLMYQDMIEITWEKQ